MLCVICIQGVGEAFLNVISELKLLFRCCLAAEFVIVAGNNTFDVFYKTIAYFKQCFR